MQQRHVRVLTPWLTVQVDGYYGGVVNLSVTGALLALNVPLLVGRQVDVRLESDSLNVVLKATITRSEPSNDIPGWRVAVRFVDLSTELKKAIPKLLSSAPKKRSR
jgi:hypothetical protein